MFNYLDIVKDSYIMIEWSQKDYRVANSGSLSVAQLPQANRNSSLKFSGPFKTPPNFLHLHQIGTLRSSFLDHLNKEASKAE
jgi:hypothetical protein